MSDGLDDEEEEYVEFDSPGKSQGSDLLPLAEKSTPDGPSADESFHLNELEGTDSAVALLSEIFPQSSIAELRDLHQSRCQISSPPKLTRRRTGVELPADFLRLPLSDVAVQRHARDGSVRYEIIHDMEQRVIVQHDERGQSKVNGAYFTKVVPRDGKGGLGMTVVEDSDLVRVHWLEGLTIDGPVARQGQALKQGVQCGDILIGVDGIAFVESLPPGERLVNHVVIQLRSAPDPVVLHLQRPRRPPPMPLYSAQSLLDKSDDVFSDASIQPELSIDSELSSNYRSSDIGARNTPISNAMHPFAELLYEKRIIHSEEELKVESRMLRSFQDTIDSPGSKRVKAFSVHIVNLFKDGDRTAYTLWVHDVGCGKEWYAPVRYFRDFLDLSIAVAGLNPTIAKIPFPKEHRSLFRSPTKTNLGEEEAKGKQLEAFIRSLCHVSLDANLLNASTLSVYIQSFLGCEETETSLSIQILPQTIEFRFDNGEEELRRYQSELRIQMKRAIQRYTFRVLMLNSIRRTLEHFVVTVRSSAPKNDDLEELESKGSAALKKRAMEDTKLIQNFLDSTQELILTGCADAFTKISQSSTFAAIQDGFRLSKPGRDDSLDRLIRDAVREQVEIDVYVPLRSIVSRWLVQGWRHEDMEIHFKIGELQKKPADFFRIPHGSDRDWSFAIDTLAQGVGQSTLPCVKLKAIVATAREIFRVLELKSTSCASLGADDFLPIFIYCVVHAKLERPCALVVLLR
jgi:Vacuolar sorting protein 9 (VPS9) domain